MLKLDGATFLPRPISICEKLDNTLTFLYAVVGAGTKEFTKLKENDEISLTGPLGNGFDLSLGLSTSYMDFVNSDEFQILLNMQNQLAIYLKVNAELQNWIDIENELKLYSKNEDNAKFKTEYEALCKQ